MHGFFNRVLKIDLSAETFDIESLGDDILQRYLGGKGLASHLLYELNPPGIDPMDAANCLIFATGPITASNIWGSSRYGVFTKSPQTGFYSESYSGGKVPEAIDSTGFDAIVIQGQSAKPVILAVHPQGVDFHAAGEIWGLETYASEDAVLERYARSDEGFRKPGAVVIGPAGENLARFAVIKNDHWRSAGRTGVGTVMGSKRVKALIFQGDRKRSLAQPETVKEMARGVMKAFKDSPGTQAYKNLGTPMMVKIMNTAGAFPTRYWSEGSYEHWEKISADSLNQRCEVKPHACAKCFMACGRMTTVRQGRHAGLKLEGPEYETLYAFGGLCLIDSVEEIAHLNDICDRLGMDTISAGNLCAFTIEAVRRGKVDYAIDYGDVDAIAALLGKISRQEGIGAVLARGIKHAAREWGLEDVAVHVKGLEPPGYDPRVLKGMGLGYVTSDRGACHLRATFYKPELSGVIPPQQIEGKAEVFLDFEDRLAIFDTFILCRFYRDVYTWERLAQTIAAVTGLAEDPDTLRARAADIAGLTRRFNLREGLTPDDDRLPVYLHRQMAKSDQAITTEELDFMLQDYFRLRGWDEKGRPPA